MESLAGLIHRRGLPPRSDDLKSKLPVVNSVTDLGEPCWNLCWVDEGYHYRSEAGADRQKIMLTHGSLAVRDDSLDLETLGACKRE